MKLYKSKEKRNNELHHDYSQQKKFQSLERKLTTVITFPKSQFQKPAKIQDQPLKSSLIIKRTQKDPANKVQR